MNAAPTRKAPGKSCSNLTKETKDASEIYKYTKVRTRGDEMDLAKLTKHNNRKVSNTRRLNVWTMSKKPENGKSINIAKRKLGSRRH